MRRITLVLAPFFALPFVVHTAPPALLTAIRSDQASEVNRLLEAGEQVNGRDETGATALMYAALYSSPEMLRRLIARGADVNAANAAGATALMWAADSLEKTRLLLDNGASINTKSSDGTTALLVATRHGNDQAVQALLLAGADPKAVPPDRLLGAVYGRAGTETLERSLGEAGVPMRDPAQLTPLLASGLLLTNVAAAKRIVAAGGTLDQRRDLQIAALRASPLHLASYHGDVGLVRQHLAQGAGPNVRTSLGATPLMFAAGSPRPSLEAIRLLIAAGADLTARDDAGRTALDWSLYQGDTPIVALLRSAGVPSSAPAPVPSPVKQPRPTVEAIERAMARLLPAGPTFNNRTKCISCHNQSLPSMAVSRAAARGVRVDSALAAHPSQATLASWTPTREAMLLGRQTIGGFVANVTYGLAGLADDGVEPNLTTDAVALALASAQQPDGSWNIDDLRPPIIDQSPVHFTALAIRGLSVYLPPGRRVELRARVARATAYMRSVVPASTQDEAFKLLGLVWAGAPRDEAARQAQRVLKLQRENGGWAQLPTMAPDAYATGQALVALHAAGTSTSADASRRGTAFLLRTQLEDGTWFVRSRAFGFQAYFETGFPHGRDQFISATATAWAVMALAESLPARP
jgi:ankyrin repeat protein